MPNPGPVFAIVAGRDSDGGYCCRCGLELKRVDPDRLYVVVFYRLVGKILCDDCAHSFAPKALVTVADRIAINPFGEPTEPTYLISEICRLSVVSLDPVTVDISLDQQFPHTPVAVKDSR